MRTNALDHIALWVDRRDELAAFLCDVCGMHEIDRTDAFTLVGGDAREGKLTLFEADGPRARGVLDRIVLRVPDLGLCVERSWASGFTPRSNVDPHCDCGVLVDAPANVPLGLTQRDNAAVVDLDHLVMRVPDPVRATRKLVALGFAEDGRRLVVGDRHMQLRRGRPTNGAPPLLNHVALLVDSVDETLREAEQKEIAVDRVVDAPNTLAAFVTGPDEIVVEYVEHKPGFALV
jgi:catechol 2,3-dioxygenase-like lactoylglutathione lyase family enzyme